MERSRTTAGEAESDSVSLRRPPTQCATREGDAKRLFLFQSLDVCVCVWGYFLYPSLQHRSDSSMLATSMAPEPDAPVWDPFCLKMCYLHYRSAGPICLLLKATEGSPTSLKLTDCHLLQVALWPLDDAKSSSLSRLWKSPFCKHVLDVWVQPLCHVINPTNQTSPHFWSLKILLQEALYSCLTHLHKFWLA